MSSRRTRTSWPARTPVWLLGGGFGHGFKHGPAMAARVAEALAGDVRLPRRFTPGERHPGPSPRTAGSRTAGLAKADD